MTTSRWIPTARLAMALARAGFCVDAVCPSGHPLRSTASHRQVFDYRGLTPLPSVSAGIKASRPDLLIPCDDLATRHLHEIYYREARRGTDGSMICKLIERSLGAPDNFPTVYARTAFMQTAEAAGVRVPKTALVNTAAELEAFFAHGRFPLVLKSDGTSGGEGVRIVQNAVEALREFRRLQAPPRVAQGLKRALVNRDKTLVWPSLLRIRSVVNAQEFVKGREATSLLACWNGATLASLHFEVLHKLESSGPATVLRLVVNPEMTAATEKMASRLKLSGLHGFDFMLEDGTESAFLIEINPRTTQVGHLTLGPNRDLPAVLYAAVSGQTARPLDTLTERDTVALFPGEWTRDPASPFLRSAYHDVPWQEPELVRAGLEKHRKQSGRYSKAKLVNAPSVADSLPANSLSNVPTRRE